MASFNYGDSRGRDVGPTSVDHSEQLPDTISPVMKQGLLYAAAVFVCFVVVCFLCVCVCVFSSDSNMISIGTVEFRYYVAIIIPVNLEKPEIDQL